MNDRQQWHRREGYGGPESFPEDGLAEFSIGQSEGLAQQSLQVNLSDGRTMLYTFTDGNRLTRICKEPALASDPVTCTYAATEAAPGIYFLKHDHPENTRLTTCLVLDINRNQAVVVDGEIPADGDSDFRVRKSHVGGSIGEKPATGEVPSPPFPPDLVGKHFVAEYSQAYAWELIYMNDTRVAWHGLKGNPGIGDVEEYDANQFAPGVYAVSWSEDAETLAAVFLYNFESRTITGHMWGYAPEAGKMLHAPLGGRIADPAAFGVQLKRPDDVAAAAIQQRNKDVVLRQHYEVWNQGRYDLIDDIYSADFACHFIDGMESTGREAVEAFIRGHRTSFPDWREEVMDIVAEGDRVVTRYNSTGTHQGEFQGIAPTGRRVAIPEVSIYRVVDGKIVEQWGFPDGLGLVNQLTK